MELRDHPLLACPKPVDSREDYALEGYEAYTQPKRGKKAERYETGPVYITACFVLGRSRHS